MREALRLADEAYRLGEVPVGAIVVRGEEVIGAGYNRTIIDRDPTAHAEMVAIRDASRRLEVERLDGCALYVTLEPCPMCAGAIVLARFSHLYFGAFDAKAGATGTLYSITTDRRLNHTVETFGGLCDEEGREILQRFFRERREGG